MNYHYNGDTFRIKEKKGNYYLYYISKSKWASNTTYIGTYKNIDLAQTAAKKYSN